MNDQEMIESWDNAAAFEEQIESWTKEQIQQAINILQERLKELDK